MTEAHRQSDFDGVTKAPGSSGIGGRDSPSTTREVKQDVISSALRRHPSHHRRSAVPAYGPVGARALGLRPSSRRKDPPEGRTGRWVASQSPRRDERCAEVYRIQVQGLASRLAATGIERPLIGVSGDLDSTQALIVACKAADRLGLPRSNVVGVTCRDSQPADAPGPTPTG